MIKSHLIKTVSLILSFAVLVSSAAVSSFVASAAYEGQIPVIYIVGYGSSIVVEQEDGSEKTVTDFVYADSIANTLKDNVDLALKAVATQDWSDFCDMVINLMTENYRELVLDGNAQPVKPSHPDFVIDKNDIYNRYHWGDYGLYTFFFSYDWRLDPTDNMQMLRDYIDAVLEATGSEKFALCGRCEGACLALTYYETYKDERMSDLIFYAGAHLGCSPIGEAFSGNMHFDAYSIERFFYETDLGLNLEVTDGFTFTDKTLATVLRIASDVYGLDLACWAVNNVYEQIAQAVTPESLRASFGSFPGFWAMCEDRFYEQAKKTVFDGVEDEYAVFIDKIDNYHYNIMNRAEDILAEAAENGVRVSNIVKYGLQLIPVVADDAGAQSDRFCKVANASAGARTKDIGETFSDDYLRESVRNGTAKYISPDLCIDASTCMFPDTTWFVKNIIHDYFMNEADDLIFSIVNNPEMTIFTDPDFPQYLFFDSENDTFVPYSVDENQSKLDEYNSTTADSFFRKIKPAFRWLYQIFVVIFKVFTPRART